MANKRFVIHSPKASSEAGNDEGLPSWNNGSDLGESNVPSWNNRNELYMEGESIPSSSTLNTNEGRDSALP